MPYNIASLGLIADTPNSWLNTKAWRSITWTKHKAEQAPEIDFAGMMIVS
jgi:hypothetical protein